MTDPAVMHFFALELQEMEKDAIIPAATAAAAGTAARAAAKTVAGAATKILRPGAARSSARLARMTRESELASRMGRTFARSRVGPGGGAMRTGPDVATRAGKAVSEAVGTAVQDTVRAAQRAPGAAGRVLRRAPGAAGRATRQAGESFVGHARIPLDTLRNPQKMLSRGWETLSNPEVASRIAAQQSRLGRSASTADKLRAGGWMAGWRPDDLRGAGRVLQYAPGRKSLFVAQQALGAKKVMSEKVDPRTGRERGLSERLGRAGMGVATGLATAGAASSLGGGGIGGLIGGHFGQRAGQSIGGAIGGTGGRAADTMARGVSAPVRMLRKKKKPQSEAQQRLMGDSYSR